MDAQIEEFEQRSHNLLQEIKKVGPDLKRSPDEDSQRNGFLYWLKAHARFRPTTKTMPQFRLPRGRDFRRSRLTSGIRHHRPALAKRTPGTPARQGLFEARRLPACHSIGEGPKSGRR